MAKLNEGMDYEACCCTFFGSSTNSPAIFQDVGNLFRRRGINRTSEIASLLRAVSCLDLTTLSGDDTLSNVRRLCMKASNPISQDILSKFGFFPGDITCAAVCVYPAKVPECVELLDCMGSTIPVAAVAAGFPSGQQFFDARLREIENCVHDGALEIDIVISRELVLNGEWRELYNEVRCMREACGEHAKLKTIISTGELGSLTNVYKASIICMAAGAHFIKTSTGKESVNATLQVGLVMARAIKDYYDETTFQVGFKPAGGIRSTKDVLMWQELMATEIGQDWVYPDLFRIGASSLLGEIERLVIPVATGLPGKDKATFV